VLIHVYDLEPTTLRRGALLVHRVAVLLLILASAALVVGLGAFAAIAVTDGVAETGRFAFVLPVAVPLSSLIIGLLARNSANRRPRLLLNRQ